MRASYDTLFSKVKGVLNQVPFTGHLFVFINGRRTSIKCLFWDGTGFVLLVNREPVFVKGANWIPDDCFLDRVTRERYADRIDQATGAGINLLRVWGGGIFETDDFYELCDEQGILVWQDFLFACAAYSEEEPMRGEVLAEGGEEPGVIFADIDLAASAEARARIPALKHDRDFEVEIVQAAPAQARKSAP